MNINTELHFGAIPRIHQKRSKIDLSHSIKTTWNNGELIPFDVQEVLPGDTIQIDMSSIVRMATPLYPVMDNMFCDIYWFFVPRRLTWNHWEEFWGQNDDEWTQTNEYEIPQIEAPSGGWASGSIADYMGIPTYVDDISIDAQYFRSYAKIYSDWFRSENLQKSAHFYVDETTRTGSNGTNYITDVELGGMPAKACKLMDYFTACLPAPQKGPSVAIPLGTTANVSGKIPATTGITYAAAVDRVLGDKEKTNIRFEVPDSTSIDADKMYNYMLEHYAQTADTNWTGNVHYTDGIAATQRKQAWPRNLYTDMPEITITGSNLTADLTNATAATINELRTAFAIQKYYEGAARYGTRYIEYLRGVFGVESSDARLQRSEYLGGMRFMVNMDQVLQTSSTDAVSPQGNTAGFSCTNFKDSCFTKSFEEHGILMGLLVTRTEHSYQQGIPKQFSRTKWTDFYNPYFANLGEMPVLNKEIYAQGSDVINAETGDPYDEEVFGYNEAWAEYRYIPNRVSGNMRSNTPGGGLDAWTYVDNYNKLPTLGSTWIEENTDNVDNTIAVSSMLANQMWGDLYIREYATRVMPLYSLPGLIDHV